MFATGNIYRETGTKYVEDEEHLFDGLNRNVAKQKLNLEDIKIH